MAQADWTVLTNSLSIGNVARGVTGGLTPPSGGGSFIYGFNSLAVVDGAVGLFCNLSDFAPTATNKGGSVRGAIKRGISGGLSGFAPFLFIGLGDDDPSHIVLKKGSLAAGLQDLAPDAPSNGIMRRSTLTVNPDEWVHLRLDMIVNGDGDVVLKVFRSDLGAHAVTSPTWAAVAGMADFIDDALEVNTGSAPLTNGRIGFGFQVSDVARRGYYDQIEVMRQL